MNGERKLLGDYADQGFSLKEDADETLLLYFKDKNPEVAVFSQLGATQRSIRAACKRFITTLKEPAGVAK